MEALSPPTINPFFVGWITSIKKEFFESIKGLFLSP